MKLDKFMFFLTSTVMLGALVGCLSGNWVGVPLYTGVIEGGMLGTNCLMGFWAFLMLDYTSSVTLPNRVWQWAKILILALVIYDMGYWRYHYASMTSDQHPSQMIYLIQAIGPLVVAVITAIVKRRLSGKGNLLPTVFFVYVFTIVDSVLVLRLHAAAIIDQTGLIMLVCNVYMIVIYSFMLIPRETIANQSAPFANS